MDMNRKRRLRVRMFLNQDGNCSLCGEAMSLAVLHPLSDDYPTLDHILPRSRGGTNAVSNIALAHRRCNERRGNALLPNIAS